MVVSKNRGPEYSTLNSRILIIRTQNNVTLIFGDSQIPVKSPSAIASSRSAEKDKQKSGFPKLGGPSIVP